MNKSFKRLFTLFLGVLLFIPTFIASSAEVKISGYSKEVSAKLGEIKYLYEDKFISKAEYIKAKEILLKKKNENKELVSSKDKSKPKKKLEKLYVSKDNKKEKKKKTFKLFKEKEELEEVSIEDLEELGEYQPIKEYPESMIKFFGSNKNFSMRKKRAASYMHNNFTRSKIWAQRKPGNMMKSMAMYEIFYLGRLKDNKRKFERYKKNWPNDYRKKKRDETAIRALKGINKARKKMREALGMDLEMPIEDAIKRFWVLGEFLSLGEAKKLAKVSPEMKKRKNLIDSYSLNISSLKEKLKMNEEKEKEIINK